MHEFMDVKAVQASRNGNVGKTFNHSLQCENEDINVSQTGPVRFEVYIHACLLSIHSLIYSLGAAAAAAAGT